jgi:hypothetical protein
MRGQQQKERADRTASVAAEWERPWQSRSRLLYSENVQKLPLTDFRAVRHKLDPHEFAISEGQDVPPSDLVEPEVWDGIMHLPEDVSIRISDHNSIRLKLLHSLWGESVTSIGDPDKPDEIYNCMLDAADCFQCANFNFCMATIGRPSPNCAWRSNF